MDGDDEDALLARAVGAWAVSGRRGVEWVARRLPKDVHEEELELPLPYAEAVARVRAVLRGLGRKVPPVSRGMRTRGMRTRGTRTFRVMAGGGAWGLNPVLVTIRLTAPGGSEAGPESEPGSTLVHLRAAAKEGLIRQRAGQRMGRRVAELLTGHGGGVDE
ncbi:hypothetical protein [Kitasatospora sp. A2-31]|uniref:hypothetical protein n=1 Tax=Kitasatospora sp. A2-31 TaxID=2916414 RepID=UPI001EEB9FCD|nr:hypothetical protein [Kitasatospora sp. A2-31]MCG6493894.1 hypothetical protein [Kitasatospora sp. A2-31]